MDIEEEDEVDTHSTCVLSWGRRDFGCLLASEVVNEEESQSQRSFLERNGVVSFMGK